MIDLLSIKKNGEYDFIQGSVPSSSGTWLCSSDITGYTKGNSYNVVVSGSPSTTTVTRIETKEDAQILQQMYSTIEEICNYLNNFFYVKRQSNQSYTDYTRYLDVNYGESKDFYKYTSALGHFTFEDQTITPVEEFFQAGDLVQIKCTLRNNYITRLTEFTNDTITVDSDNFVDTTEDALIFLMNIPQSVQNIINQLIHYNVYEREVDNLQSESVGNYSSSKRSVLLGSLYYPPELINGLESFKKVRFF